MWTKSIISTKPSKVGPNFEQIHYYNGKWYDVEKSSYIMVKFHEKGKWFIMNKNSDYLKCVK